MAGFGLERRPEVRAMILPGVKQALLVLPFSFVTFILGKQKKSKDGVGIKDRLIYLLLVYYNDIKSPNSP